MSWEGATSFDLEGPEAARLKAAAEATVVTSVVLALEVQCEELANHGRTQGVRVKTRKREAALALAG